MGACDSKPELDGELTVGKVQVMVPEGAIGGSQLKFQTPDGRWIQAEVPEGYSAGDLIYVDLPELEQPKEASKWATLHEAFVYLDPKGTGYITDHDKFAEVALALANLKGSKEEVWKSLDQDGNGQVNWPEFVEWAEVNHVDLKLGLSGGEDAVSFPPLWTGPTDRPDYVKQFDITDTDHFMELDQLLQKSYKKVWTRDRKKTGVDKVPLGFELVKAKRCENLKDWKRYYFRRHQIAGACSKETKFLQRPVLTSQAAALYTRQGMRKHLNEWLLFHGTSPEAAQSILSGSGDFVISLAGSATGTLYGRGTYFAESITKADEYAKEGKDGLCCALVCRVAAGHVLYNDEVTPDAEKLQESCISGKFHSILGDREKCRGTFKEFVIFDADQVYVEYALFYKRRYS